MSMIMSRSRSMIMSTGEAGEVGKAVSMRGGRAVIGS